MIEWLLLPAEKMAAPATAATLALFVCGMVAGSAVTTSDPAGQSPVLQSPCRFTLRTPSVVETVTRDHLPRSPALFQTRRKSDAYFLPTKMPFIALLHAAPAVQKPPWFPPVQPQRKLCSVVVTFQPHFPPIRPLTKRDRNEFNFASEVNSGDELSAAVKSLGGE